MCRRQTIPNNKETELPKSGQTETNTTLWSVLLGFRLAFIRNTKLRNLRNNIKLRAR